MSTALSIWATKKNWAFAEKIGSVRWNFTSSSMASDYFYHRECILCQAACGEDLGHIKDGER